MAVCDEKSWLEAELEKSMNLLRSIIERMNNLHPTEVESCELADFKNIYKVFYYISCIKKNINILDNPKDPCNSWLRIEIQETIKLHRQVLENMNQLPPNAVDSETLMDFKNLYKTLYYAFLLEKDMEVKP